MPMITAWISYLVWADDGMGELQAYDEMPTFRTLRNVNTAPLIEGDRSSLWANIPVAPFSGKYHSNNAMLVRPTTRQSSGLKMLSANQGQADHSLNSVC